MEFDYTNLREFIKINFRTLKGFAVFLGLGTTQLGQRLSNKVPFTQKEIDKVANGMPAGKLDMETIDSLFLGRNNGKPITKV